MGNSNRSIRFWHILLVSMIFSLLILLVTLIYKEVKNEKKLKGYFTEILENQMLIKEIDSARFDIVKSQDALLNYLMSNNDYYIKKYFDVISKSQVALDTIYYTRNHLFDNDSLSLNDYFHSDIGKLKKTLDTIYNKILPKLKEMDFSNPGSYKKLDFKDLGVKTTIKTEKIVDTVKKQNLFERIGKAITNDVDIQEEKVINTVIVEYYNDKKIGPLEEQLENLLNKINQYYKNELRKVNARYASIASQKQELLEMNINIQNVSKHLYSEYKKALVKENEILNKKYDLQYIKNRTMRFYILLAITIILTFFALIVIFLTRLIYKYEDRLIETRELLNHNLNVKNKMVSMISHDIRAPLKIISLYMKQLLSAETDMKKTKMYDSINYTTNSALLLANKILNFSKNETKNTILERVEINLHNEINDILESFVPLAAIKSNKIENNNLIPKQINLNCDRPKLQRIYFNLLDNAIKYTLNGTIKVTSEVRKIEPKKYRFDLTVKDTGKGIDLEQIENIFEPFKQLSMDEIKNSDMGVGLGLHLCKEIVDLMNGEITIKSKLNKGTEVKLYLIIDQN